jgi:hypothetical protein
MDDADNEDAADTLMAYEEQRMKLFQPAQSTQAFLKAGFMGFAGAGKTFTATDISIGLVNYLKERGIEYANRPVFFLDTETGSDYVIPRFREEGIDFYTAKTRAFSDLLSAVEEAEKHASVLLIDSISHFWSEFTESYAKKRNRKRGLEFSDWAWLKQEWRRFTDLYVNSNVHILMCGRAGYEYDFFTNDNGKKELEKTGVKMKAETETGYEPSILVLMEREMESIESKRQVRRAYILKERFNVIDGKTFTNPRFKDFLPHIELLNLGGQQLGVDTSRNSEHMIPEANGNGDWKWREAQREIYLEKTQNLMTEHGISGRSQEGKEKVIALLKKCFDTSAWREVESYDLEKIKDGFNRLHMELNGAPYFAVEAFEDVPG